MKNPLVSIVVPLFTSVEYLKEAFASFKAQTYTNWQLHVGVNGYDFGSSVVDEAAKVCVGENVRVLDLGKPASMARAANILLERASGPLVCFCDADDVWEPEKLAKQVRFMATTETHVLGTMATYIGDKSGRVDVKSGPVTLDDMLRTNHMVHSSVMAREGLLHYTEEPSLAGIADYDCFLRMARDGRAMVNLPDVLVKHRVHKTSGHNNRRWPVEDLRTQYTRRKR